MYNTIKEYKAMASGATWDDKLSANIKSDDPASVAFWEGYTWSPVSSNLIIIIIKSNHFLALKTYTIHKQGLQVLQ